MQVSRLKKKPNKLEAIVLRIREEDDIPARETAFRICPYRIFMATDTRQPARGIRAPNKRTKTGIKAMNKKKDNDITDR